MHQGIKVKSSSHQSFANPSSPTRAQSRCLGRAVGLEVTGLLATIADTLLGHL